MLWEHKHRTIVNEMYGLKPQASGTDESSSRVRPPAGEIEDVEALFFLESALFRVTVLMCKNKYVIGINAT